MSKIKILVTGVGGGVGQSIMKGLNLANMTHDAYEIYCADADIMAAGLYRCKKGYIVPGAADAAYVNKIIEICTMENIQAIIPGTDPEVEVLAEHREDIQEKTSAKVITSSYEAIEIGFDKFETYKFLKENGFITPETSISKNAKELMETLNFPIVVKPRRGSASVGLFICTDENELKHALSQLQDPLSQEYAYDQNWDRNNISKNYLSRQTDEYSTEVFVDSKGKIVSSITNWRTMKKGIPSKAIIDDYLEINEAAKKAVAKMQGVLGPVNLQCRMTSKGPCFFEINTRFSGSTAVRCAAGFNGPHQIIRNVVSGINITKEDLAYRKIVEIRWNNELYVEPNEIFKIKQEKQTEGEGKVYDYF